MKISFDDGRKTKAQVEGRKSTETHGFGFGNRLSGSKITGVQSASSLLRGHSEQEVIILFPRDPGFIENSGGEVEFQMLQEGKERKVKFKIKDFTEDPRML